jgi:hypothetical protein
LLTADGDRQRGGRAVAHLARCSSCRQRRDRLQQSLNAVAEICRTPDLEPRPSAAAARARLQLTLATLSTAQPAAPSHPLVDAHGRLMQAAALVVLCASGMFLASSNGLVAPARPGDAGHVFLLPIQELTPGAVRRVDVGELCGEKRSYPARITASLQERVFRSYGADVRRVADYELDYLITPELGGTSDAQNLWPQAYARTPWNAFVKDELERSLHRDVCEGRIELAAAQQQIAQDWIGAYKRHFNTSKPLRDYDTHPLTAVDRELLLSELEEQGVVPMPQADGSGVLALFHATRAGWVSGADW